MLIYLWLQMVLLLPMSSCGDFSYFWKVIFRLITPWRNCTYHFFQTGEHYVNLYKSQSDPCWNQILFRAEENYCKADINDVPGRQLAMELLVCYNKQKKKPQLPNNCLNESDSTLFKKCISTLNDESFDDFMVFFGQVSFICDYFNSTLPIVVNVETIGKASNLVFM